MASVNKVILIGNLGGDPEVRSTGTGQSVATLSLATKEAWQDKSGQKSERTEWHRVIVWGRQAELCKEYLSKGRQIYVEGRLQTREWTGKDGNKKYTTEVVAQRIQFLGSAGDRRPSASASTSATTAETQDIGETSMPGFTPDSGPNGSDGDIPF